MADRRHDVALSLGRLEQPVAEALEQAAEQRIVERMWQRDTSLWAADASGREEIAGRLGWLDAPGRMREQAGSLRAFADGVRGEELIHAVVLGMGGSSLAPEVLGETFGPAEGYLHVDVLDDTSVSAVQRIEDRVDVARTLFLVSSKSGTTAETLAFFRYFREQVGRSLGAQAGSRFAAITDPGSPLEDLAAQGGFRETFLNPPDVGGRYSALTYVGLVPAALLGIDLERLTASGRAAAADSREADPGANFACRLGVTLGTLARHGRDKLTLLLSPAVASLGGWIEQLVAESTGKQGLGIVPVDAERTGVADCYGDDRVFVSISCDADSGGPPARALDALAAAGHPVLRWHLPDRHAIGGEFFDWELAVAVAGSVMGINPFDEPDVNDTKQRTREMLAAGGEELPTGEALAVDGNTAVYGEARLFAGCTSVDACLERLLGSVRPGDYTAILAYLPRAPSLDTRLDQLRLLLRDRLRAATTLGHGPRYLHSTGQLHKGGADNGIFVLLTTDPIHSLPIPGEPYGFERLHAAQALGDFEVLKQRGRRVLRIHLGQGAEAGVKALLERLRRLLGRPDDG